jgi:phage terminase small subunit
MESEGVNGQGLLLDVPAELIDDETVGMPLTHKQMRLAQAYVELEKPNWKEAALKVGMNYDYVRRICTKSNIVLHLQKLQEERAKRAEIDADRVLDEVVERWRADVLDIFNSDGTLKPLDEWPEVWRKMMDSMEVQELWAGIGEDREKIGRVVKVKFPSNTKLLEMIGKHLSVGAFGVPGRGNGGVNGDAGDVKVTVEYVN